MPLAFTREISPRFNECEITHIERTPIDLDIAREQHRRYVAALQQLGCAVVELPAEPEMPDSVFIEDTAVILPEAAIITRPGADSRKAETESVAQVLSPHKRLLYLREPATLDGGDVLVMGRRIFIGVSTRSNSEAIAQLNPVLQQNGYTIIEVRLHGCLHLKSAVTRVDDQTLLINQEWVDADKFADFELIEVDPDEPHAANCLPIGASTLYPASFPKTRAKLETHGCDIINVELDEIAKAEGAVTCCSLILV